MARRETVVVTGGAGFLGSHLCERLLLEGYAVVCVDNLSTGSAHNVRQFEQIGPFELIEGDVIDSFRAPGASISAVLHFASAASPAAYLNDPVGTLMAGSVGTLNALQLASRDGARFLLASTSEIYGDPAVHPQPESYCGNASPVGLRSPYYEAKRFAEALTTTYRRHGVDTAIVRIFNTYGPRMHPFDGRVVPSFIRQALEQCPLTVAGDGLQTRTLQYVDDCVEGCLRLLHSSHAGPMNIGGVRELPVIELATMIRDLTHTNSEIVHVARPEGDPSIRKPDITLAVEALGWFPTIDLEVGLTKTIDWFRSVLA